MIKEITEEEALRHFQHTLGWLQAGDDFRDDIPGHVLWLREITRIQTLRGARFFASFSEDEEPIGILVLLIDKGAPGMRFVGQVAEILVLGVEEGRRSQGHGRALLVKAEEVARESGCYCLYTSTYAPNHRAISFYGCNGLVPGATLPDVHGPGDEGMVDMRKVLR